MFGARKPHEHKRIVINCSDVSVISTYWRKPDYTFNPCDFAGYRGGEKDLYTKKTCLWVGGGFKMPQCKRRAPLLGSKMHLLPPSADRANLRSVTPMGFAQAVFEANCPADWRLHEEEK